MVVYAARISSQMPAWGLCVWTRASGQTQRKRAADNKRRTLEETHLTSFSTAGSKWKRCAWWHISDDGVKGGEKTVPGAALRPRCSTLSRPYSSTPAPHLPAVTHQTLQTHARTHARSAPPGGVPQSAVFCPRGRGVDAR